MPPVFGPAIVFEDALVILCHDQRHGVFAIGKDEKRNLRARETLFKHDSSSRIAKAALLIDGTNRRFSLGHGVCNDHTLSGGQPIRFDHRGRTKVAASDNRDGFADVAADFEARCGDADGVA